MCRREVSEALLQNQKRGPFASEASRTILATMALNYQKNSIQNIFAGTFLQSFEKLYNLLCITNCFHKLETSMPKANFLSPPPLGNPCFELFFGASKSRSKGNILDHRPKNSPLCSFRILPKQFKGTFLLFSWQKEQLGELQKGR